GVLQHLVRHAKLFRRALVGIIEREGLAEQLTAPQLAGFLDRFDPAADDVVHACHTASAAVGFRGATTAGYEAADTAPRPALEPPITGSSRPPARPRGPANARARQEWFPDRRIRSRHGGRAGLRSRCEDARSEEGRGGDRW